MAHFSFFRSLILGALAGGLLAFPREAAQSARAGMTAFAGGVIPALLPFTACVLLLTAGRTLPLSLLTLLALPGGSPTGARLLRDAGLRREAALGCAARTGGMSFLFFLSTLSGWLQDPAAARLLLAAHVSAGLLASLCSPERPRGRVTLPNMTLPQALFAAAQAMLGATACAAFGAAAARVAACALPGLPPLLLALGQSALEVTGGVRALIAQHAPLPLLAAATGFTGLGILLQNAAYWQESGVSLGALTKTALLRAGLSAALVWIYSGIFRLFR